MLWIKCPVCGVEGDETDFHAGGQAHLKRPESTGEDDLTPQSHHDYLFLRQNLRGITHEMWHCGRGCGKWFHAARDTKTMDFKAIYKFSDPKPDLSDDEAQS